MELIPGNVPASDPAVDAWNAAKDSDSQSVFESFIAKFGNSFYAALAKAKLDELRKKTDKVAVTVPSSPATPSKQIEPATIAVPNPEISQVDALALIKNGLQCGAVLHSVSESISPFPIRLSRTWAYQGNEANAVISFTETSDATVFGRPQHLKTAGSITFKYADLEYITKGTDDNEVFLHCLESRKDCITTKETGRKSETDSYVSIALCDADAVDKVQKGMLALKSARYAKSIRLAEPQ